jgi:hypothetical protein
VLPHDRHQQQPRHQPAGGPGGAGRPARLRARAAIDGVELERGVEDNDAFDAGSATA